MKIIQCSRCGAETLRTFPCSYCNPKDKTFHLRKHISMQKEETRLLKQALREKVDETAYHEIMDLYNHKLQQFRKNTRPYL